MDTIATESARHAISEPAGVAPPSFPSSSAANQSSQARTRAQKQLSRAQLQQQQQQPQQQQK
jgi:hypothetical protein